MNHDVAEQRNRRLERADAHISRCGECGAWQWMGRCPVDHDAHVISAGQTACRRHDNGVIPCDNGHTSVPRELVAPGDRPELLRSPDMVSIPPPTPLPASGDAA